MSEALENYRAEKNQLVKSKNWASLLGKPYVPHDGRDFGVGHFVDIEDCPNLVIYHYPLEESCDEIHGVQTYYRIPESLRLFLAEVLNEEMPDLIQKAIAKQEANLKTLAKQALADMAELATAAGLEEEGS